MCFQTNQSPWPPWPPWPSWPSWPSWTSGFILCQVCNLSVNGQNPRLKFRLRLSYPGGRKVSCTLVSVLPSYPPGHSTLTGTLGGYARKPPISKDQIKRSRLPRRHVWQLQFPQSSDIKYYVCRILVSSGFKSHPSPSLFVWYVLGSRHMYFCSAREGRLQA